MLTQEFEKTAASLGAYMSSKDNKTKKKAEPWFYDRGSKNKAAIIKARNKPKKKSDGDS